MELIRLENIYDKIITVRNNQVILDSDVAFLYGVETRDVNKAVKNNPEKFPERYVFPLSVRERKELLENYSRFDRLKHSTVSPKAFTEQGLYMLATVLKSPRAVETSIAIIDAFTKLREVTRNLRSFKETTDRKVQKNLMEQSAVLVGELLQEGLEVYDTETTLELNLAILKIKQIIKKKRADTKVN